MEIKGMPLFELLVAKQMRPKRVRTHRSQRERRGMPGFVDLLDEGAVSQH